MSADPELIGNGRYVPLSLYLEDRRELRAWMGTLSNDVREIRRELDRDDGREVAEEAAETALERKTRSRGLLVRDAALCLLSAAATATATFGVPHLF